MQGQLPLTILLLLFACPTPTTAFKLPKVSDELGCSPTLSVLFGRDYEKDPFFFDPLGIATDTNFSRLREGELKSSRITMLVVAQSMAVPLLKRSTDWVPKNAPEGILANLQAMTLRDFVNLFVTCGILETVIFVQRDKKAMPGDYGTGYFGKIDKGSNERSLIVELENGRLSMLAFVVQVILEYATGKPWVQQWSDLLSKASRSNSPVPPLPTAPVLPFMPPIPTLPFWSGNDSPLGPGGDLILDRVANLTE